MQRYEVEIRGIHPGLIMHNGTAGLETGSPAKLEIAEIARKKGVNRTELDDARLRELECQVSLWLDENGRPTVPEGAIRATIETGARKLKQGAQVREGLIVERTHSFSYDAKKLGKTVEELGKSVQFVAAVVVQRNRILRTRARFDPWSVKFDLVVDPELCGKGQIERWLDIASTRIGLGDWRPEKSGIHGRFEVVGVKAI